MSLLRSNFEAEAGPYRQRASSLLYNGWVEQAGGRIKGSVKSAANKEAAGSAEGAVPAEQASKADAASEDDLVVPLWLLKQSNEEQVGTLRRVSRNRLHTFHPPLLRCT